MHQVTDDILYKAVDDARAARREEHRYPFFRAATIEVEAGAGPSQRAFVRDISTTGIGLLHFRPLERGLVQVCLPAWADEPMRLPVRVTWCRPAAADWYLSGGGFERLSIRQSMLLCVDVFKAESSRRLQQRYPFFEPVTISWKAAERNSINAFARDISSEGMGLLHSENVPLGRVNLSFLKTPGQLCNVSADIRWCRPSGNCCYISGCEFRTLLLQELQTRTM